jgi:CAAX prenyl protease-like protein
LQALAPPEPWLEQYPSARYVAPFLIFIAWLAITPAMNLDIRWEAPVRVLVMAAVCYVCWPQDLSLRPERPLLSMLLGLAVFVLWIAPDLLIPGYRQTPAFSNSVFGHLHSSLRTSDLQSSWVLFWRTMRAVLIVPIVEELFWRAWLMRWLINPNFKRVPLGAYAPLAFWVTALLFASEHGPYWDVGLLTGIIYNLWMIRTKSVADCIVAHAVTNGILSAYVIASGQWQYWQ